MNNTKHTPGPHFAVSYANFINMQSADEYSETDNLLDMEKCPEAEANGKLYEASPAMLNTLKTVLFEVITNPQKPLRPIIIELIEATIKKATE